MKNSEEKSYVNMDNKGIKNIRTEILLTPLLVILPLVVSFLLIYDWFIRGFSTGNSAYDGELMFGVIILLGNLLFDVPFIKSLINLKKQ